MKSHPQDFNEAVSLALTDKQPYSWRSAWVLWACMDKDDKRLRKHVNKIIKILPERQDNQQRELLMILQRMELNPDQEAQVYDICVNIWTRVGSSPSIRCNAMKLLVAISKRHPDLRNEMKSLMESRYVESLTPGARKSVAKMTKGLLSSMPL